MEYDPWNSSASCSRKQGAVDGDAGMDNGLQSRLSGDMLPSLLYTRGCIAEEPLAMRRERDGLEFEVNELRHQGKFVSSVRKHVDKDTLARDGKNGAEIGEAMNGLDNLKYGTEHFRAEYGYRILGEQLNIAREQRDAIKERANLVLEAQTLPTDRDTVDKKMDALKFGQLRTEHKDSALQQHKMDALYAQYEKNKRERNALILNLQGKEEDEDSMRMGRDYMNLGKNKLRGLCRDGSQLKEQTNVIGAHCADMDAFRWKVRGNVENRDASVKERDSPELERLKAQCQDGDVLQDKFKFGVQFKDVGKDTDDLELKNDAIDALYKQRDELIIETEKLRSQCEENALLEGKLNALILKCDRSAEDRDTYTLEAQSVAADIDAIAEERKAIRMKNQQLRAQCEQRALLEKQTHALFVQYEKNKRKRDALMSKFQDMEEDEEDIRMDKEAMKLQKDELQEQCKDSAQLKRQINAARVQCVYVNRDREAMKLKVRRNIENRDAVMKDRDALKLERQRLKVQCEDSDMLPHELNFVSFQVRKMEEETNDLMSKVEAIEALKKERDALRIGIEKLRTKCKEGALLEGKLNALNDQRENSAKERDAYMLEAQSVQDDIDGIDKENGAIRTEIEELRAQSKESALLEKQLNTLFVQYHRIKRNRNNLILKFQGMEENEEAIRMERDNMRFEKGELLEQCKAGAQLRQQINIVRAQCVDISRERNDLKLKVRRIVERRNALFKERDALELERRQLKVQCEYSDVLQDRLNFESCRFKSIEKETNDLMLKAEAIDALKKGRDALRSETEKLQAECKENALLEDKLNTLTLQRKRNSKERDTYIREAQSVEDDINALEEEIDSIKMEIVELGTQSKGSVLLERQINNLCVEYERTKRNRNSLVIKLESSEDNEEAVRDRIRVDKEKLRGLCRDGAQMKQQINVMRGQCVDINRDREVRRNVEYRDALMKERDALELERARLTDQCANGGLLQHGINVADFKFKITEKERRFSIKGGDYRRSKHARRSERQKLRASS
jgi:hypothetical protein